MDEKGFDNEVDRARYDALLKEASESDLTDVDEKGFDNEVDRARYDALLKEASESDITDVAASGVLNIEGRDALGRPVVVLVTKHLPAKSDEASLHHVLLYALQVMDRVVLHEYTLVVTTHGMERSQRPPARWLKHVYNALGRPFKKNVKLICLVHPSGFAKFLLAAAKPFVSQKVYHKVKVIESTPDLFTFISPDNLYLPADVFTHLRKGQRYSLFGVTVEEALASCPDFLPPLLADLHEKAPPIEGVFRVPGRQGVMQRLKSDLEKGIAVDWSAVAVHDACGLLKLWLRELRQCVVGREEFQLLCEAAPGEAWRVIDESAMPDANKRLMRDLVELCVAVVRREEDNKMTAKNVAVILGPVMIASSTTNPMMAVQEIQKKSKCFEALINELIG